VSSSSFGTLMATAFIAAGKQAKGREDLAWDELAGLLSAARDAVMARGKAGLGNKTVVDALDAAAHAAVGQSDPDTLRAAVLSGVNDRIVALRSTPAQIGRARIFAERSIGMDDPGMIAFRTMVEALGQR
jgi:dihydroxyacetone kinase-like protein